jgi:hypothetical protein
MALKLKKQNLKKLNNQNPVEIDINATRKIAGGYPTGTGCFGNGCQVH